MNNIKNNKRKSVLPNLFFGLSGLLFCVAVFVFLKVVLLETASQSLLPSLSFTPAVVQFGSISQGVVTGKATVKNISPKSVIIDSVISSCDCTQILIEKGILHPGTHREISFQWDTRGRRGKSDTLVSVAYFIEDETIKRVAPLSLSATIIPDFDVIPNELIFHSNKSESLSFSLKSTGHGDNDTKIKEVTVNHPAFSVVIDDTRTSGIISFDSDFWTDNVRQLSIQIMTSNKNEPIFRLPINIIISENNK
ncbi:MAG: DUF1573 domain-containing protein [Planctomycetaceae bacterium]|jgi:hypothetical protein|nr:DUF1573 domain-containing protein [Planctomycetaceae bacterium]